MLHRSEVGALHAVRVHEETCLLVLLELTLEPLEVPLSKLHERLLLLVGQFAPRLAGGGNLHIGFLDTRALRLSHKLLAEEVVGGSSFLGCDRLQDRLDVEGLLSLDP